jgi:hypothetical protein
MPIIFQELHNGVGGGHCSSNIMMRKIFDVGYWWPTMNRYVHEFFQTYDLCKQKGNLLTQNMAMLIITLLQNPSKNGGVDFIEPIKLVSCYIGN